MRVLGSWMQRLASPALTVLLCLVPVAVVAAKNPSHVERVAVFGPSSTVDEARIGRRFEDGIQPGSLSVTWRWPSEIRWHGQPGIVTSVAPPALSDLVNGRLLFSVNTAPVFAQVGSIPLFRDLEVGARGFDVLWLDEFLRQNGAASETTLDTSGAFTRRTGVALQSLRLMAGEVNPDRVMHVSQFVYIPEAMHGTRTNVIVGDQLVDGSRVVLGKPSLESVSIELTGPEDRQALLRDEAIVIHILGSNHPVNSLKPSSDEVASLLDVLPAPRERSVEADTQQSVVDVTVSLRDPIEVGTVPSSAIVRAEGDTAACIIVVEAGGERVIPIPPSSIDGAGEPGIAFVDVSLAGQTAIANPSAVRAETECG